MKALYLLPVTRFIFCFYWCLWSKTCKLPYILVPNMPKAKIGNIVNIMPASHPCVELLVCVYEHAKMNILLKALLSQVQLNVAADSWVAWTSLLSFSPPICRAEGDLSDGNRKFSPNSESSLEPQKTCGEQHFCLYRPKHTHTHIQTYTAVLQSIHPLTHWLAPNHVGDSSLSGSEDQSCWMHSPSAGNPINLQEELFHGAILSSHLNIYSQSVSLCWRSVSRSFWHPLSSLTCSVLSPALFYPCRFLPLLVLVWIHLFSSLFLSGGFSETYAALCDYNGIGCKEEVQWVRTLTLFVVFSNILLAFVLL